jgi:dTDP-4-dehydrorhamnose 3,5-epimerase
VDSRELIISGAFVFTPRIFQDSRGSFAETFRNDVLDGLIGHEFSLRQMNTSISQRGSLRGIHFAEVPNGQAKYVTVPAGRILDFVVDIRVDSPTFGKWESVEINSSSRNAIYLSEGLGHAFLALEDDTVVTYLVSDIYRPEKEHGINPLDPELGLVFPMEISELLLSPKDTDAPSLMEAKEMNLLPSFDDVNAYISSLNQKGK